MDFTESILENAKEQTDINTSNMQARVNALEINKALQCFFADRSFVDPFCYLFHFYLRHAVLSVFFSALWSHAWKGLTHYLSCESCFCHFPIYFPVRYGT